MPTPARSLTEDLRRRDDEALAALILRRPDLARPAPIDLTTLVSRATTPASLRRALEGLTSGHLATLEAVLAIGPARIGDLATMLEQPKRSPVIRSLVADLEALALIWNSADGYVGVRTLHTIIAEPGGLGPHHPDAPQREDVAAALADLDPAERRLLDALTWGPPVGTLTQRDGSDRTGPAARLIERGLLFRRDQDHVALPRSVALSLRGGRLRQELRLEAPELSTAPDRLRSADQAGGARAGLLIDQAAEVIDRWGADPPRRLRGGGLAARDLAGLATRLEISNHEAAWLVETMMAAGLIDSSDQGGARSSDHDPVFGPTAHADVWATTDPAQRWEDLARAWLAMSAAPWSVGSHPGAGRVNALSIDTGHPAGRQRRHDLLRVMALTAATIADVDALSAALTWHHPLRAARTTEPELSTLLEEAQWAGIVADGMLTTAGRAVIREGGDQGEAAALMSTHIPAPVDRVLVQADLTVVAPGRIDGKVRTVLHLVADLESRGGASVHRFSEASIRRALDTGWTADRILDEIGAISATGLPQPLDYLVRDVARRHGVARVGTAGSYIRSDEPALLDRMLADRALSALNLTRIAPTVLISPIDPSSALDLLRERSYGPVAESVGGQLVLGGPRGAGFRVPPRRNHAAVVTRSAVDPDLASTIVSSMRTGETARERSGSPDGEVPNTDPAVTQSTLGAAAADGAAVVLGYADDAGGVTRMIFWPEQLEAGRVRGHLEGEHHSRRLLLHRITGARTAV